MSAGVYRRALDVLRVRFTRQHRVGPYRLALPPGCRLDVLQGRWPDYDRALGALSALVFERYPAACAVDIGANIGDTAALICSHREVDVLCIEGMPSFLPSLRHNAATIGPRVRIHEGFVGDDDELIDLRRVFYDRGTGSTAHAYGTASVASPGSVAAASLGSILAGQPELGPVKLLKSDTDGSDFKILLGSMDVIRRDYPALFFEYDTRRSSDGQRLSLACIDELLDAGYRRFLIYDNFGRLLRSDDRRNCFDDLNRYLDAEVTCIDYFDVCAFHSEDVALAEPMIAAASRHGTVVAR